MIEKFLSSWFSSKPPAKPVEVRAAQRPNKPNQPLRPKARPASGPQQRQPVRSAERGSEPESIGGDAEQDDTGSFGFGNPEGSSSAGRDVSEPARRPMSRPPVFPRQTDDEAEGEPNRSEPKEKTRSLELTPLGSEDGASGPSPSVSRVPKIHPTDEQFEEIINSLPDILTVSGGIIGSTDRQRLVVAFGSDGSLFVHKANPLSPESMEVREAVRRTGRSIHREYHVELADIRKIHEIAERRAGNTRARSRGGEALQKMQHEVLSLINEAAENHCSDIHINVGRFEATIRMRSDGVMVPVRQVRADWATDLCAAAFNMADASDASYRPLEYQGARISEVRTSLPLGVQSVRLQFNPLPNGGRYLVARLLYANSSAVTEGDVDTLGYASVHVEQIRKMRRRPFGINIVSGPTGSGKSTTLQRALTSLMREKRGQVNVITIEDPPEYVIDGASQLPVLNAASDEERSEKFRAAISAALRSDPDIIMIGEIRDKASSSLAFAAAMTGHQVWASLHTNDAISILDRLRDQHIELYKLSDHTLVTGLIGQRLIRRLCSKCRLNTHEAMKKNLIDKNLSDHINRISHLSPSKDIFFANTESTCTCRGGYVGREVVAETICPDMQFMQFIREEKKNEASDYWLKHLDGITMLEHAVQKMVVGLCDPRDVEDKVGDLDGFKSERASAIFGRLAAF